MKFFKKNNTNNIFLQLVIGFIILMALFLVLLMFLDGQNKSKLKVIDFRKYEELVKNEETFILYLGSSTCSACEIFTPTFNAVLKEYKLSAYYLELDKITKEEYDILTSNYIGNYYGITPTVTFHIDGVEQGRLLRIEGAVSKGKIISKLKSNGFIE